MFKSRVGGVHPYFGLGAARGLQEVVAAAMFSCFVVDFLQVFFKCCDGAELEFIPVSGT